jgi:hypothetical protein
LIQSKEDYSMTKQKHRPRKDAQQLILNVIASHPNGLTRTQIADALMRTKTPHLIRLIEELVDEGFLVKQVKIFHNGVEGYVYLLGEIK